jgi:Holliday junction resolvase RusA-like endonuclease
MYESWVSLCAREAVVHDEEMRQDPSLMRSGALRVEIIAYLVRPKTRPKKYLFPDKRPDMSNIQKAVEDGINQSGLWTDDAQICRSENEKRYATPEQEPGVWVVVEPWDGGGA